MKFVLNFSHGDSSLKFCKLDKFFWGKNIIMSNLLKAYINSMPGCINSNATVIKYSTHKTHYWQILETNFSVISRNPCEEETRALLLSEHNPFRIRTQTLFYGIPNEKGSNFLFVQLIKLKILILNLNVSASFEAKKKVHTKRSEYI